MFCSRKKCPHYSQVTKYPRKCYYELMCWKGYLDLIIEYTWVRFIGLGHEGRKRGRNKEIL